ncbi:IS3 family transposase [Caballeronia sp. EK]|uniref:IS3 family transposase n=1 Tax=Caballeronia sp. EK TaxID=2767469 RepID=UPI0028164238|nr:IS3 family transposase [Caballeronia sp. EK]
MLEQRAEQARRCPALECSVNSAHSRAIVGKRSSVIESFSGTLKSKLAYRRRFAARPQAQQEMKAYTEIFYNQQRIQARFDHLSLTAFTQPFSLNKIAN